jgi:MOSC domain-containing protein YiiM
MAQVSLFIGGIRTLPESGRPTGIYKQPVTATIRLEHEGFVGDQQADRRVHGGPEKAVHLYPSAHYAALATRFPAAADHLIPGSMGENLATADLDESHVRVGDIWQLGEARLQVCQPRNPCWKIDERFGCEGMAQYIHETLRTGWYWRVVQPGNVTPGDALTLLESTTDTLTLRAAMQLWQEHRPDLAALDKLAQTPGIASNWQGKILQRIGYLKGK